MTTTMKKAAHETEDGMSELVHEARERIAAFKDESVKTIGKQIDAFGSALKMHPLLTVGIGIGVGYLLARIVHRG